MKVNYLGIGSVKNNILHSCVRWSSYYPQKKTIKKFHEYIFHNVIQIHTVKVLVPLTFHLNKKVTGKQSKALSDNKSLVCRLSE